VGIGEVKKAVIFDRDATLIDVVRDEETGVISVAFHPSHLKLLTGVVEGLSLLRDAGYTLAIATNQPAAAKGQFSRDAIQRTNDALVGLLAERGLPIARVAVCLHHQEGGPGGDVTLVGPCDCRKPKPGLLVGLIEELELDPATSWMVGDSPSDVEAGRAAKLRTGLVFPKNRCELCPLRSGGPAADVVGATVLEIAQKINASQ